MLKNEDIIEFKILEGETFVVGAVNEHFAVCIDEDLANYTIIDFKNEIRGTHNSYGQAVLTMQDCQTVLERLMDDTDFSISHRNNVPLDIKTVNGKAV